MESVGSPDGIRIPELVHTLLLSPPPLSFLMQAGDRTEISMVRYGSGIRHPEGIRGFWDAHKRAGRHPSQRERNSIG